MSNRTGRMALLLYLMFVAVPPVAWSLGDTEGRYLLVALWIVFVLPGTLLLSVDLLRSDVRTHSLSASWRRGIRVIVGGLGLISGLFGCGIIVWCLYNVFVRRLPDYSGPRSAMDLLIEGFGIAPSMLGFAWYCLRLATGRVGAETLCPRHEGNTAPSTAEPWP